MFEAGRHVVERKRKSPLSLVATHTSRFRHQQASPLLPSPSLAFTFPPSSLQLSFSFPSDFSRSGTRLKHRPLPRCPQLSSPLASPQKEKEEMSANSLPPTTNSLLLPSSLPVALPKFAQDGAVSPLPISRARSPSRQRRQTLGESKRRERGRG